MKKVVETYVCDICGNEEAIFYGISYPVVWTTEQTEGRKTKPYIQQQRFDVCKHCADKILRVSGRGAQGFNEFLLRGTEDEKADY